MNAVLVVSFPQYLASFYNKQLKSMKYLAKLLNTKTMLFLEQGT